MSSILSRWQQFHLWDTAPKSNIEQGNKRSWLHDFTADGPNHVKLQQAAHYSGQSAWPVLDIQWYPDWCLISREWGNDPIHNWLVVGPPLWKIWKSIGMIIPNIWENKIDVPKHQPDKYFHNHPSNPHSLRLAPVSIDPSLTQSSRQSQDIHQDLHGIYMAFHSI